MAVDTCPETFSVWRKYLRKSFKATSLPFSSVVLKSGALSLTSMGSFPRRTWLYRTTLAAVTLLMSIQGMAQGTVTQYGRKPATSKGPRAIGLIQLFPNGKAHLIPVAISV